jgi:TIR domain
MDGYENDVFISYRRTGNVAGWVQRHLSEVLTSCLEDELDRSPKIFIDNDLDTGAIWPDKLEKSLHRSRLMVAVLSPPYFTSSWCQAEWRSMFLREQMLGLEADERLIFPLVFSDGDRFPDYAKARKSRSMKAWGYPYPQFAGSQDFLRFHDEVRKVACEIAGRLDSVPDWDANWPFERPSPVPNPVPAALPEL